MMDDTLNDENARLRAENTQLRALTGRQADAIADLQMKRVSDTDVLQGLTNLGISPRCGACVGIFFTGSTTAQHNEHCTRKPIGPILMAPSIVNTGTIAGDGSATIIGKEISPSQAMEAWRERNRCEICCNPPDDNGEIEHGKGCYVESEYGGGFTTVDEKPPFPPDDGRDLTPAPIPMVLSCPLCHARHVDVGEFATKLHHTHACQHCGHCWRPAIVPTVGVEFLPGFKDPLVERLPKEFLVEAIASAIRHSVASWDLVDWMSLEALEAFEHHATSNAVQAILLRLKEPTS